jgi:hypothetical protein
MKEIIKAIDNILKEDKRGNNPIPDPLRFSYIYPHKEQVASEIDKIINEKSDYTAKEILRIDVPKENFTIRPMARPSLIDWVIYQYIVNSISPFITDNISSRSYSIKNFKNPKRKIDPWKDFEGNSLKFCKSGYKFCVVTDISGYFENINLEELRSKIFNYVPDSKEDIKLLVNILFNKFLYRWSMGRLKHFGLPQGPQASSYLGDIYLDHIDKSMEKFDGYFRYMDDIRIFCKTKKDSRIALIELIRELRKYKLNINSKKTRILEDREIYNIFDEDREFLNIIQDAFDSKNKTKIRTVLPIMYTLLKNAFAEDSKFSTRHIRFTLFRFSLAKNSGIDYDYESIINLIIRNFSDKPHLSDLFCEFLVKFPQVRVKQFLHKFLFSEENIYEWQELYILRSLLEISDSFGDEDFDFFISRMGDKNMHWALRSLYALLIGKYASNTRREQIKDIFFNDNNDELRKNIILSTQELGTASRNEFYNDSKDEIWPDFFIKYVKGLKSPMYFWPYENIRIEDLTNEDLLLKYE